MRTLLISFFLAVAAPAWAQELPDAGLPDAGVEGGSAQGMTEENDPQGGPCLTAKDCTQGFACVSQRCVPVKPKNLGCNAAPVGAMLAGALLLALRRRRG